MKPPVLVTGASGFVGRTVAAALATDFEVWALTRSEVDLDEPDSAERLRRWLPAQPLEAVLHLAARLPGGGDLEAMIATNAVGTHLLLAGLPAPPRRFGYFSTVDVYGIPPAKGAISEDSPATPATAYAIAKYAGERLAWAWCRPRGVAFTTFRLSQVYGVGDPTPKVIPSFCAAAAAGSAPAVHGSGAQLRQPLHVRDVAAAAVAWSKLETAAAPEVLLLAGQERVSVLELARLVMSLARLPGSPGTAPGGGERAQSTQAFDTRRTEEALGWRPQVTLETGLREILDDAHIRT